MTTRSRPRVSGPVLVLLGLGGWSGLGAPPAAADGAFPDSSQVLLPPGQTQEATLATNFGLIATHDGGGTWEWTCETPLITQGQFYQLGTPGRTVASSLWGVVRSDDGACTWDGASGEIARVDVTDVFVNAADPRRALAIGVEDSQEMGLPQLAYASDDGGATFGAPIFRATGDTELLGIESAAADPANVYLALDTVPEHPGLAHSTDAGATWERIDAAPMLGPGLIRIVAVDRHDPGTIFLRLSRPGGGEALAVSTDGGHTLLTPFSVGGSLAAFVRRENGTILVAGTSSAGEPVGARSFDGGRTFEPWEGLPHLRGLAERDGVLYGAADDVADGFALGISTDDGASWKPWLRYADVGRIKACAASACARACGRMVALGLWDAAVCVSPDTSAGTTPPAVGAAQGGNATADAVSPSPSMAGTAPRQGAPRGGCSYGEIDRPAALEESAWVAALAGALVALRLRLLPRGPSSRPRRHG